MFVALAFALFHDIVANVHNIPNDAWLSFADGDDLDLPILLD